MPDCIHEGVVCLDSSVPGNAGAWSPVCNAVLQSLGGGGIIFATDLKAGGCIVKLICTVAVKAFKKLTTTNSRLYYVSAECSHSTFAN